MKNFNALPDDVKQLASFKTSIDYNLSSLHSIMDYVIRNNPSLMSYISTNLDMFIESLFVYVEENINSRTDTEKTED